MTDEQRIAEWNRGWQDGFDWTKQYFNQSSGKMPLPEGFMLRGYSSYWNGWDEGSRCAR